MTEPQKSPVDDPKPDDLKPSPELDDKQVSYETHRKLLNEKKKLQEKHALQLEELEKFRKEKEALEEQRLKDAGDYETLKKLAEEKRLAAEQELSAYKEELMNAKKLNAIVNGVQGTVDKKFYSFIDTGSVVVNPETGELDENSVAKAVEVFQTNYPELIQTQGKNFPSSQAPASSATSGSVSMADYVNMSPDDRKKNAALVEGVPDWMK